MNDRVKIGYRVSKEAVDILKMAAIASQMSIEKCLDYLIRKGEYPTGCQSCKKPPKTD